MKIKRKYLTNEQKEEICRNHKANCGKCPLRAIISSTRVCLDDVKMLEMAIFDYWSEDIEVDI